MKQKQSIIGYYKKYGWRMAGRDLLHDIIGSILYAAGIYTFAATANFAPGGITGIAMIINHYVPFLRIGLLSLIINVPVAIICYRLLGRVFFFKSVKSMLISALFLDLVFPLFPQYDGANNPLLAALFAGALSGAGLALIYMPGSSTGGTDFIIMSIRKKKPHLSIGTISMIVDGTVILLGGVVFGNINAVLYGVLMTIVSTTVIDKVMYGTGTRRMLLVISDKAEEIAKAIMEETERGATLADVRGAYTGQQHQMMMCVCSKVEVFTSRRIINRIDPGAIVMLTTVDEAYGEGFMEADAD
ncbi:MAG: YitT family protein [Clostridia bacterium]|nr:YitT family protein [Clostridia bacterium]MBR3129086.1 YitT family protein [Clostridia bacterium]